MTNIPFALQRSNLTGLYWLIRKFTLNENQADEARAFQAYFNVHPSKSEAETLKDAIVVESRSDLNGTPMSLRLRTEDKGYSAEGPKQVAELILTMIDAASYAEGMDPKEYAARLFERTGARV